VSRTRVILHLDLDAFFCAVEEQRDPSLKGVAFAVGGQPDQRGVVASCSYPARQFGVRSAMPMSQAVRLCPELVIVRQHFDLYRAASKQVMQRLNNLTPFVEQISIDEAFLDVTGIPGTGRQIAEKLQSIINTELNLPCSIGVASNKHVAKIANNLGKAGVSTGQPPNWISVVEAGQEADFLAPLPIHELWGVGPKTAEKLKQWGIETVGDIAKWPIEDLERRLGKIGADIARRARGLDDRRVEAERDTKSISKEITFTQDVRDRDRLEETLHSLSEGVGLQLRRSGLAGKTVQIKLRWSDFTTLTRQKTSDSLVDQDDEIFKLARTLLYENWQQRRPVRLIGVGVTNLHEAVRQHSLWESEEEVLGRKLQSTLDDIRDRFGDSAVKRGTRLKKGGDSR